MEHIWAKDNLVTVETAPVLGEFANSLGKARLGDSLNKSDNEFRAIGK
jgi:hypothetical protein